MEKKKPADFQPEAPSWRRSGPGGRFSTTFGFVLLTLRSDFCLSTSGIAPPQNVNVRAEVPKYHDIQSADPFESDELS